MLVDGSFGLRVTSRCFPNATGARFTFAIPGAGHNDTYVTGGDAYWRTLADFLESVGGLDPPEQPGMLRATGR